MAKSLPLFVAEATCRKCGGKDIRAIWKPIRDERPVSDRWDRETPDEEHIERVCPCCSFAWFERPLDTKAA